MVIFIQTSQNLKIMYQTKKSSSKNQKTSLCLVYTVKLGNDSWQQKDVLNYSQSYCFVEYVFCKIHFAQHFAPDLKTVIEGG